MIIVDIETGGLDCRENPILSIGAVDFESLQTFYGECHPRLSTMVEDEALAINGFTHDYIWEQQDPNILLSNFRFWVARLDTDFTIAGVNPSFDRDFLFYNFKHFKIDNPFSYRTVDLHSIAYAHMKKHHRMIPLDGRNNKISTDVVLVYTGIPAEPRPHNGLKGAIYEAEAFSRLIYKRSIFKEFRDFELFPSLKHYP